MNRENYQQIFKSTFLFGGTQIIQILITLIKGKLIAFYLGSIGMGISGLYSSSLAILITIASLGCNMSAVRYISCLDSRDNTYTHKLIQIYEIFICLSIAGAVLTICLSKFFSYISFGSSDHTKSYLILSLYVFFSILSNGMASIFQGTRQLKTVAKGNIIPAIFSLLFSYPFYCYLKINAIVPTLILLPCFISVYYIQQFHQFVKKRNNFHFVIFNKETEYLFKGFVSLGIVTVCASLLGNLTTYLINTIISYIGNVRDVGLYQASISITNQYVGLVFTAMSMDYFPKLASVCHSQEKINEIVNNQGEITILLAFPLLSIMMLTSPLMIALLLSEEFLVINSFIKIVSFGMIFKATSFCLGYISFSKGDKKTYFFFEGVLSNMINFMLSGIGYYLNGLQGLACSFVINYILYLVLVYLMTSHKYKYKMDKGLFKEFCIVVISLSILFGLLFNEEKSGYIVGTIVVFAIIFYSIVELNKRINFKLILKK